MPLTPEQKAMLKTFSASVNQDSLPRFEAFGNILNSESYTLGNIVEGVGLKLGEPPRFKSSEQVLVAFTGGNIQVRCSMSPSGELPSAESAKGNERMGMLIHEGAGARSSGILYLTDRRVVVVATGSLLGFVPFVGDRRMLVDIDYDKLDSITLFGRKGKPDGRLMLTAKDRGRRCMLSIETDQLMGHSSGGRSRLKSRDLPNLLTSSIGQIHSHVSGQSVEPLWHDEDGDLVIEFHAR